ncbi:MAG TPA: tetratricopeptide repeat protein [Candidatus Acidoferrales bacterium]|nr:tetratricopeptide repeat protein [Candidatus Acidoferrales bacterium]
MPIETTTTQDVPAEIIFKLWPWLEQNRNKLIGVAVAIFVAISVYYFMASQREENERAAGAALTQLMLNPPAGMSVADALTQLATKYSGTVAAQRAQLQAAATQFGAGKYADAQAMFEKFVNDNNGSSLASTAQLGIGASLEAQGKSDLAAAAYQRVVSIYANTPSYLPALCGQGRIAEAQGKFKEALDRYETAYRASNGSGTLAQEAMMRATELQPKVAAMTPKPVTSAAPPTMPAVTPAPATAPAAK